MTEHLPYDLLITHGTIVTVDADMRIIEDGWVGVRAEAIAAIGRGTPPAGAEDGTTVIDARGGIVMPGLVNAHSHLPMTLFRGLADDLPLHQWLNDHIFPVESRYIDPETVRLGTLLGCAEMLLGGTTTCCDGYFLENHVAHAVAAAGMRGVLAQGVIDYPAPGVPDPAGNVAHAVQVVDTIAGTAGRLHPAIFCHSPYTCSALTLKRAKKAAADRGLLFLTHVAETRREREDSLDAHGKSPVRYLESLGVLDDRTLLVHAVWIDETDLRIIADTGSAVAHCPESNMKLASGVAPVPDMLRMGIPVGLGTDGSASNNDLDLFLEMDTAAKLHKVHRLDPTVADAAGILKTATISGAAAIGLADQIGSIEPGKKADMVVIDTRRAHLVPMYDPVSHIVYAVCGGDVRDVVVGGRVCVRDGRLETIDLADVMDRVKVLAGRIAGNK